MEQPQDQFIDVQSLGNSVKTRYWNLGSGTPLVLIHGLGGYIENWELNVEAYAAHFEVFALDIVGFGHSDRPDVSYTVRNLAKFVLDFMTTQGIERALVAGHSLGGMIALQVAISEPEKVEKLLLISSGGFGKEIAFAFKLLTLPVLGKLLLKPSEAKIRAALKRAFYDETLVTDERVKRGFKMASLPGVTDVILRTNRTNSGFGGVKPETIDPILQNLAAITVPVMTCWGKQDSAVTIAHKAVADEHLQQHRSHVFDPCGHWPQIEHAEAFNRFTVDFLTE